MIQQWLEEARSLGWEATRLRRLRADGVLTREAYNALVAISLPHSASPEFINWMLPDGGSIDIQTLESLSIVEWEQSTDSFFASQPYRDLVLKDSKEEEFCVSLARRAIEFLDQQPSWQSKVESLCLSELIWPGSAAAEILEFGEHWLFNGPTEAFASLLRCVDGQCHLSSSQACASVIAYLKARQGVSLPGIPNSYDVPTDEYTTSHPELMSRWLLLLGEFNLAQHNTSISQQFLIRAAEDLEDLGLFEHCTRAFWLLGDTYRLEGRIGEASEAYELAFSMAADSDLKISQIQILRRIASMALAMGDSTSAEQYLQRALMISEQVYDPVSSLLIHIDFGDLLASRATAGINNFLPAFAHYAKTLEYAHSQYFSTMRMRALESLDKLFADAVQRREAADLVRAAMLFPDHRVLGDVLNLTKKRKVASRNQELEPEQYFQAIRRVLELHAERDLPERSVWWVLERFETALAKLVTVHQSALNEPFLFYRTLFQGWPDLSEIAKVIVGRALMTVCIATDKFEDADYFFEVLKNAQRTEYLIGIAPGDQELLHGQYLECSDTYQTWINDNAVSCPDVVLGSILNSLGVARSRAGLHLEAVDAHRRAILLWMHVEEFVAEAMSWNLVEGDLAAIGDIAGAREARTMIQALRSFFTSPVLEPA